MSGGADWSTTQSTFRSARISSAAWPLPASVSAELIAADILGELARARTGRSRPAPGPCTGWLMNSRIVSRSWSSVSRLLIGLSSTASAPYRAARSWAVSVDMMQTGMCRVVMSFLSRSMTRQPSISGRQISSVIASGLYSLVIASAAAPSEVTSPLKPFSRAASSSNRANDRSFSTIKSSGSPGSRQLRSSPTSLTSLGVSRITG